MSIFGSLASGNLNSGTLNSGVGILGVLVVLALAIEGSPLLRCTKDNVPQGNLKTSHCALQHKPLRWDVAPHAEDPHPTVQAKRRSSNLQGVAA